MTAEEAVQEKGWTLEEKMQTASMGALLIHPAVVLAGMYGGFQASKSGHGTSPIVPLWVPLWIANILGTAYWQAEDQLERAVTQKKIINARIILRQETSEIERTREEALRNVRGDAVKGAFIGLAITPIEYIAGWGTGYALGSLDKVFS